ncbi:unnamed protein product [Camellia sinensis]
MANYHFVYKDVEGASTQWDDIQRKLGNLSPKPPVFNPPSFKPAEDEDSKHKDKAWIDGRTEEQPQDLKDDPDLDDDRFLQECRKKRLGKLRQAAKVQRYGSVVPISGSDFVREVSQAPPNVWVIVILYKDRQIMWDCIILAIDVLLKIPKDVEDVKSAPIMEPSRPCKDVELSPSKDVEPRLFIDVEDPKLKLGKDIKKLKSKLNVLESKLSEKLDVALGKIEA